MNKTLYILLFASFFYTSCKKKSFDDPINKEANVSSLNCAVCPSKIYDFTELETPITTVCDDFTNLDDWPTNSAIGPASIGYTQEDSYEITIEAGVILEINSTETNPGFYGVGDVNFEMSGDEQVAEFDIYGIYGQFGEMNFSINESTESISFDEDFPLLTEGVYIDLDSITTLDGWTEVKLTISGVLNAVKFFQFESGITQLCVTKEGETVPPTIDKTGPIYFTDFLMENGTSTGYYPNTKTPTGYYGNNGIAMFINFNEFLAYSPSKISIVHAHPEGVESLINLKLPGTPYLVTTPADLNNQLTPFNYEAVVYTKTGKIWLNNTEQLEEEAIIDSIIITGQGMNIVTIGANLTNSELRSVCTYYEE